MRNKDGFLVLFLALFTFCLVVTSVTADNMMSYPTDDDCVELVSSSDQGVTFKIHTPVDRLIEETLSFNSIEYVNLSIPGWSQISREGEPKIPVSIENIGIPFGVDFVLSVTPGEKSTRVLSHPILPESTQSIDWDEIAFDDGYLQAIESDNKIIEHSEIYAANRPYPGSLAKVTSDGVLRHQRVIGVSLYPVQYVPVTRELIIYEYLEVTINFSGLRKYQYSEPVYDSIFYEDFFRDYLLNYNSSIGWREKPDNSNSNAERNVLSWKPPDHGWRVYVREEGFYKLGYDELDLAGLPVDSLNPQTFQIFNLGDEVAIHVEGQNDATFDSGDYILFYGQSIDSKYTSDNIYWLTFGNTLEGLRMGNRDVFPGTGEILPSYMFNNQMEENNIYWSTAPGDETLERWFWEYILTTNPQTKSYTFSVPHLFPGQATLEIRMLGYLQNPINPDHHVKVYLENSLGTTLIGEVWWDGITWEILEVSIEADLLQAGDNTIIIECPVDTGVGADWVFIDKINLKYPRTYKADNNKLEFTIEEMGVWKYYVEGFTTGDVAVYDVSDPTSVFQLTGGVVATAGTDYTFQFEDANTTSKSYWVITDEAASAVSRIEQDIPSNLQIPLNSADYLIITHGSLSNHAEILRSFRVSQGLEAIMVDVQDIYDEFSFGIVDPHAIRDFLAYAIQNWDLIPSFVLLFGDGHFNPKGYNLSVYDNLQESLIPPYLSPVDPTLLETAADNRYVTLVGDDILPDMMLGRLAVNNTEEAAAVVEKIIAYETTPPPGDWRKQILLVADNPDNAGNFYLISDNLLDCCLPAPFNAEKIYYKNTHLTKDAARAAIQEEINSGKLIVNYIGHATTSQWEDDGLVELPDIADLLNGDMMPVMLTMTCMDGYYINPDSTRSDINPSIAETFTRVPNNGAVASWSPTGWGTVSGHDVLNRGFFNALFQSGDGMLTLGMATQAGKMDLFSTGTNQDLMDTYLLFGDPATRIAFNFSAINDNYEVEEDNSLDVSSGEPGKRGVLNNDIHPQNSPLSAVLVEDVTNGQLDFNSDGSFIYTPKPDYFGTDSFTYYASDGAEDSNIAVVEITILPVDEKIFLPVIQH